MKTFKKIFLGLFILVTVFALFIVNTKNVKAESLVTHDQLKVEGAGVRTTGKAGIRFVGSVGSFDTTNVTAYGICIAYGETDANDNFVKGETINDKVVLYGEDTALDKDGHYYVVLYNIPEEAYAQNVTARAYVIINGTAIAYGAEVKVRSLASTVVNAVDDEQTGDLIDTVYAKIDRISVTANDYNIIKNNKPTKFVNTNATGKSLVMFEKPSATAEELIFAKGDDVFTTLEAANTAIMDSDKLYLFAGSYSLSSAITKKVTIMGPNYGVKGDAHTQEEAVVDFYRVAVNTNTLVIDGIKIDDTKDCDANGTLFVVAANTKDVTFQNCYINLVANLMRFTNLGVASTVDNNSFTVKDCLINDLYQYIIWSAATYGSKLTNVNIIGNTFQGSKLGTFDGGGMIRVEAGTNVLTKVYNNKFMVNLPTEWYFYNKAGTMDVRFNTFNNVSDFNYTGSTKPINYNYNYYLDGNNNPLTSVPARVGICQGVADECIFTSAIDLQNAYQAYLDNVILTLSFEENGGNNIANMDIVKGLPYVLPTCYKSNNMFLGWTLTNDASDANYVTSSQVSTFTTNLTLYAKWEETDTLLVSGADITNLNDIKPTMIVNTELENKSYTISGTNLDESFDAAVYKYGVNAFDNLKDAIESASNNDIIYVFAGSYSGNMALSSSSVKVYGPNYNILATSTRNGEAIITGKITIGYQTNNSEIAGFKFVDNATIEAYNHGSEASRTYGLTGLIVENCIIDKGSSTTAFLNLEYGNRVYSKDLSIIGCSFTGSALTAPMIRLVDNENTTIDYCVFNNIPTNVVHFQDSSNGLGLAGSLIVTNSRFTNITKSAIWINWGDSSGTSGTCKFDISYNYFENIEGDAAICYSATGGTGTKSYNGGFSIARNTFKNVFKILKNARVTGLVFNKNIIYLDDDATGYIVKGNSTCPINCAGNLYYTTDGSSIITDPYTQRSSSFDASSSATANTDNYATYEAYLAALEN